MSASSSFISSEGYVIPKNILNPKDIFEMKKELTLTPVVNKDYSFNTIPVKYYRETPTHFIVPKYYGINKFGKKEYIFKKGDKKILEMSGSFKQRENQIEITNKAMSNLEDTGGVVISILTGGGKTVCALYLISELSKKYNIKPLIIVNKIPLLEQWKERIEQFMPKHSVGIIQGKNIDRSKDITLAMLHTISLKKEDVIDYSYFNCVILDEAHHTPSKEFSNVLFKTCGQFTIGLSATPERKDGLTKALVWGLGEIISLSTEEKRSCLVKLYEIDTPFVKRYLPNGKLNMANAITSLCGNHQRTLAIKKNISELYKEEERKILVLSDRIALLEELEKILVKDKYDCGLYIGKLKRDILEKNSRKRIILASFSIFSEGIDIPELNSMVLCSPKSDIIQVAGRIFRKKHNIIPVIIDIVDTSEQMFVSQSRKRRAFYKKSGFTIINLSKNNDSDEYDIESVSTEIKGCGIVDDDE